MNCIFKNKKIIIYSLLSLFLLFGLFIFVYYLNNTNLEEKAFKNNSYQDGDVVNIEIRDENNNIKKELEVELALSPQAHYQGLSNRDNLSKVEGMLFIFNNSSYKTFVMRNMNFSLDILFIKNNEILNIEKNLKPEGNNPQGKYSSIDKADMVLEVNGGYSDKYNIEDGDVIKIKD